MFIKNGSYKKHTHIISYVPPTIINQPIGGTKSQGNDFTFTISARGSAPLTYQWYKNFSPILNETANELILTNLQITDDSEYYCVVSNNGYSTDSDIVKLNVLVPLTFTSQPTSVQVNKNSNISFTAHATGTPPITYKWYKNSELYPGTTDIIYINHVTKNEEGSYFAIASNLVTSITSNTATLTINDGIIIKDQPDDTTLNVGDNLTLTLSCVGTFPISAQWRKNNTNYGSLSVTNNGDVKLQISNIQSTDAGNYDCVLTNLVNSVTSNKAIFYVSQPPVFTINPLSGTRTESQSYTFTSNATGTNPISYQWIKENYGVITGATFKNYTLSNLTLSNSGKYACVASNLFGTVTSNFVDLVVVNKTIVKSVVAGYRHSLFLGTDGTLFVVGLNSNGQLGVGTTSNIKTPVKINLPPVAMVAAGGYHSLAIGTDGTLSAFGYNPYGQLGDGTTTERPTPVKINLPPVSMVAAGYSHSLFLGTDGTLSACGDNRQGQLGDGTTTKRLIPVKINLPPVAMVAAGYSHSLFLGTDGTLSACGDNELGQLGDGTTTDRSIPVKINLPPVAMVAAGGYHSLAIGTDGTLSACGDNTQGQLGDGTTTKRPTPVKINLPPVSMVAAGESHSLFLGTDGTVSGCGDNRTYGQLGVGTTLNYSTPVICSIL